MTSLPTTLADWLVRCEQLHPTEIDMGLQRVEQVRARLDLSFKVPLVAVAGTNGKGSTCAMLESIALHAGYRVGLYSKPHLVHFEERCRVNGAMVSQAALLEHFEAVEAARGDISLTYFEFTTLAIARLLSLEPLDLVILEVGLGGRLDAVNVFDADCAVITSIDLDHTEFLGPDRESIGREKAGIMRPGRPVIVSDPLPPQSVLEHAASVGAELWRFGVDFNHAGDKQQWGWAGRRKRLNGLAYPGLRGANQLNNASGALAAFESLGDRLPITAQSVRQGLRRWICPAVSRSCLGSPRWCSMWPTTRTRWLLWRKTWITWDFIRAPMSCSAPCTTRTSRPSFAAWRPSSIHGASPTCRRREPPRPCNSRPCTMNSR